MRKVLFIAVLIVSGVFTSCTDTTEEVTELIENELQSTGGEEGQTPIEDDEED